MSAAADFLRARDFLIAHRTEYAAARRDFRFPQLSEFNWALDHFDVMAAGNDNLALWIVEESGEEHRLSFRRRRARSNQVANWLRAQGVQRGDRVLLMLGNEVALWETMLAAIKLGAVRDSRHRPAHARRSARSAHARCGQARRRGISPHRKVRRARRRLHAHLRSAQPRAGWRDFAESNACPVHFHARRLDPRDRPAAAVLHLGNHVASPSSCCTPTRAIRSATCRRCTGSGCSRATSISTSRRRAGPSTHGAVSSRHGTPAPASSSTTTRASTAKALLDVLERCRVTTLCAPPTVWRMLIQEDLAAFRGRLAIRELIGAGEPLNPEIIDRSSGSLGHHHPRRLRADRDDRA